MSKLTDDRVQDGKGQEFANYVAAVRAALVEDYGEAGVMGITTFQNVPRSFRSQLLSADNTAALLQINLDYDNIDWHHFHGGGGTQSCLDKATRKMKV